MKSWIKKVFKGWNAFELSLVTSAFTIVPLLGVIFNASIWEIIASTGASVATTFYAKGKIGGYFISFFIAIFEAIVAWQVALYSTVINIFAFAYPMLIFGIVSWFKNRRNDKNKGEVVKIGKLGTKDALLLICFVPILCIVSFLLLRRFDSRFLLLSTGGVVFGGVAAYMIARRSQHCFFFYILTDIIGMVLWGLLLNEGHTGAVPMIALQVVFLSSDVYGFFEWHRLKLRQLSIVDKI